MSGAPTTGETVGRPRRSETDASIRDATRRLLVADGYGDLTIEGVARLAGVGKPTIYRRHPTKAAMVADALGAEDPPRTERELRRQLEAFRAELRGTRAARDAARYLLVQPPLPLAGRAPYGLIGAAAVALMPVWTRWPLRLPWLPVSEALAMRPAGAAVTRTLRWVLPS